MSVESVQLLITYSYAEWHKSGEAYLMTVRHVMKGR
jgi:hypothetical protein